MILTGFKNHPIYIFYLIGLELKPEVRRFVNAQKRKDTRTVEQMYIENLRKKAFKKPFKTF